jgi:hypothetical protein
MWCHSYTLRPIAIFVPNCLSLYIPQLTLTACSTQKIQEDGSFQQEEKAEHTHKSERGTGQRWKLVVGTITEESKNYFIYILVTGPQKK